MYSIELNKVTNLEILKKIYVTISNYNLTNQIFLTYIPNIEERSYKISNLMYHTLLVNIKDLEDLSREEIEEILYDFIELNSKYIFNKSDCNNEIVTYVEDVCKEIGIKYIDLDYSDRGKEVNIEDLTTNELNIVYEILEYKNKFIRKYTPFDFVIKMSIDDRGDVYTNKGDFVGNLFNTSFVDLLFRSQTYFSQEIEVLENMDNNYLFETSIYEPWIFLSSQNSLEIAKYIEEYKIKVFEAIKNIKPYQYKQINRCLVDILNELEYIQYDDIYKIVSGEDIFLEYYKQ